MGAGGLDEWLTWVWVAMSIRLMSSVWRIDGVGDTERLLLMALADHANDSGVCWPGLPHLALKTHKSLRQIQRRLRRLEHLGFFSIENPRCGRGHHKRFILNLDKFLQERVTSEPQKDDTLCHPFSKKGVIQDQKGDIAMSQKGDIAEHKSLTTVMNHLKNRTDESFLSRRTADEILCGAPPPALRRPNDS